MATLDAPVIAFGRIEARAERVLILGAGPSLAQADLSDIRRACAAGVKIIAVNAALSCVNFSDFWFTLDFDQRNRTIISNKNSATQAIAAVPDDFGPDAKLPQHRCVPPSDILYVKRISGDGPLKSKYGLSDDPGSIHTGNSVWGALGVAWHLQASRVGILGLDGSKEPGFPGAHKPRTLDHLPRLFESALSQLLARGVEVRNGNQMSRVTCFARAPAADVLRWLCG